MITLRKLEIPLEKDIEGFITDLQWNIEKIRFYFLDLFWFFRLKITRAWIGAVDREAKEFKVIRRRNERGVGGRISSILIKGHIVQRGGKKFLSIEFKLQLRMVLTTFIFLCLIILYDYGLKLDFYVNIGIAIVWLLLLFTKVLITINDLNDTENEFLEYIHGQKIPVT